MSTTTRTIFWPVDLPRDVSNGFCYGWSAATKLCVAGVLDVDTEDDARNVVSSLDGVLVESCGSQVVVLGKSAELLGNTIFYYRHRSDSLRFYHLHLDDHDEHTPSPYFTLSQHDFTHRPLRRHDGLDDTSINHFNSAMLIESLVSPRSSKKLVPRTASILFAVASILARPMLLLMLCIAPIRAVYLPSFLRASAVVQQLDVRAEQAQFFVSQIGSLQRRDTVDIASYASRYTKSVVRPNSPPVTYICNPQLLQHRMARPQRRHYWYCIRNLFIREPPCPRTYYKHLRRAFPRRRNQMGSDLAGLLARRSETEHRAKQILLSHIYRACGYFRT